MVSKDHFNVCYIIHYKEIEEATTVVFYYTGF